MRKPHAETLRLSRRYLDLIGGQGDVARGEAGVHRRDGRCVRAARQPGLHFLSKIGHRSGSICGARMVRARIACCRICSAGNTLTAWAATAFSARASIIRASSRRFRTRWGAWRSTARSCWSLGERRLARLLAAVTPGELGCCFFINNGTDADRRGDQARAPAHQAQYVSLDARRVSRQVDWGHCR